MPTPQELLELLRQVKYPGFNRDIVSFGMVRDIQIGSHQVTVELSTTSDNAEAMEAIRREIATRFGDATGLPVEIVVETSRPQAPAAPAGPPRPKPPIPGVGAIVAVASGKGGVGKSTLTANLAAALAERGERVGVLDADVYGYSIPHVLGVTQRPIVVDSLIVPPVRGDLKVMSIGLFAEDNGPIMWRGPMLHKALQQFLSDVHWGELDTLVVDMPPGTGDVAISIGQLLPRAEAIVVTTPQPAAQQVAVRAAVMAQKTGMRVVGVVENMSWLVGTGQELFGSGGGEALAAEIDAPLLARVPFDPALREASDAGRPVLEANPDAEASVAIRGLADAVVARRAGAIRKALTVL